MTQKQRKPRFSWRKEFLFELHEKTELSYDGWDVARIYALSGGWRCMLDYTGAPSALVIALSDAVPPGTTYATPDEARAALVAALKPILAGKSFDIEPGMIKAV